MRLAVITDIHANREALEAVLEHAAAQQVDRYALLGDFVGYGADPGWVVDRCIELCAAGAVAVQGNHDMAVVRGVAPGMREEPAKVIGWTRERLDERQIAFLAELPLQQWQGDHLYVHANAWAPAGWEYIATRADAVRSMGSTPARFTFCGHMHEPQLYHLSAIGKAGEFTPTPGVTIPLPGPRQWLVIPGSCGQPRDGNPAACYAIFDRLHNTVTYQRVPYDHETAGAKILAAELPQRLAFRLEEGA